eukprot:5546431-Alexandrium_andersonii.AAC.1
MATFASCSIWSISGSVTESSKPKLSPLSSPPVSPVMATSLGSSNDCEVSTSKASPGSATWAA